ncbi:hypothetical protein VZH09_02135 [Synechococcus elongatus IITB7]|uniref:hypothetical protein n=1 Tax=Synechococcus elongatus TaxID=32046 RepID=UPI0030CD564F
MEGSNQQPSTLVVTGGILQLLGQLAALSAASLTDPVDVVLTGAYSPERRQWVEQHLQSWLAWRDRGDRWLTAESAAELQYSRVLINVEWQAKQRQFLSQGSETWICGDSLGFYYRQRDEVVAVLQSLAEIALRSRSSRQRCYALSHQPRWYNHPPHRWHRVAPQDYRQLWQDYQQFCWQSTSFAKEWQTVIQRLPTDLDPIMLLLPNLLPQLRHPEDFWALLTDWCRPLLMTPRPVLLKVHPRFKALDLTTWLAQQGWSDRLLLLPESLGGYPAELLIAALRQSGRQPTIYSLSTANFNSRLLLDWPCRSFSLRSLQPYRGSWHRWFHLRLHWARIQAAERSLLSLR